MRATRATLFYSFIVPFSTCAQFTYTEHYSAQALAQKRENDSEEFIFALPRKQQQRLIVVWRRVHNGSTVLPLHVCEEQT